MLKYKWYVNIKVLFYILLKLCKIYTQHVYKKHWQDKKQAPYISEKEKKPWIAHST